MKGIERKLNKVYDAKLNNWRSQECKIETVPNSAK